MGPAFVLDGTADSAAFEIYVEQILAPSLRPGQIVIVDHLSIHLGPRVKQAIEARGCRLLFLPAYSPNFLPIEEAFSKLKTVLRRAGAHTREAGHSAIAHGLRNELAGSERLSQNGLFEGKEALVFQQGDLYDKYR